MSLPWRSEGREPQREPRILYAVDSRRATFAELWRSGRTPLFGAFRCLGKLLRIRARSCPAGANVESLRPFACGRDELAADDLARIDGILGQLGAVGFATADSIYLSVADFLQPRRIAMAIVPRGDGRACAQIVSASGEAHCEIVSEIGPGTFLHCSSARARPEVPARVRLLSRPLASATALWALHQEELAKIPPSRFWPARPADAMDVAEWHHALLRNHHLARGVFRPLSAEEAEDARALEEVHDRHAPSGEAVAEVMVEAERIQRMRRPWSESVTLLVLSVLAFVLASRGQSGLAWRNPLLLVPILFFHEAGHYAAMRFFGYRNLRMFFIPFFGAAVAGEGLGIAGWKKGIVSLMGPLPGIAIAAALAGSGALAHHKVLAEAATLALILNGINLLPVMPLDGGRVAHLVLFSRHPLLDAAFRALAGVALLAAAAVRQGTSLFVLGVLMISGLPASYRLAIAARDLRETGLEPMPIGSIPQPSGKLLVERVRAALPRVRGVRILARHAVNVCDMAIASAPRWRASVALVGAQVAGIAAAVIFAAVGIAGAGRGIGSFFWRLRDQPRHALSSSMIEMAGRIDDRAEAPPLAVTGDDAVSQRSRLVYERQLAPRSVLAADLGTSAAVKAMRHGRTLLREGEAATRLGDVLLVALRPQDDAARKRWLLLLGADSVEVIESGAWAPMDVRCTCADDASAKALAAEMSAYGALPDADLIPPWMPPAEDRRSPEERAHDDRARRTYWNLRSAGLQLDPQAAAQARAFANAMRGQDKAEIMRLREEWMRERRKARDAAIEKLRASPDADQEVIQAWLAHTSAETPAMRDEPGRWRQLSQALAPMLGHLPMHGAIAVPGARRYSANASLAVAQGKAVRAQWLVFDDLLRGPPAFVRWLESRGCSEIRFDLRVAPLPSGDSEL